MRYFIAWYLLTGFIGTLLIFIGDEERHETRSDVWFWLFLFGTLFWPLFLVTGTYLASGGSDEQTS